MGLVILGATSVSGRQGDVLQHVEILAIQNLNLLVISIGCRDRRGCSAPQRAPCQGGDPLEVSLVLVWGLHVGQSVSRFFHSPPRQVYRHACLYMYTYLSVSVIRTPLAPIMRSGQ